MSVTRFVFVFFVTLATLNFVGRADAARIWTNGNNTWLWNDAANWAGGVPGPNSGQDALFDATSPGGIITVTGATLQARHISFGSTNDTIASAAAFTFNDGGSGVINIRNGGVLANYSLEGNTQTFNVAYTQANTSVINTPAGAITFNGLYTATGTLTIADSPTFASTFPVQFLGGMAGAGNMVVEDATPVTVGGTVTRAGTTTINGGTFLMNGTHTGGGDYTVGAAATLGGIGSISSNVGIQGTVAPGNSIDTLSITGNVALDGTLLSEVSNSPLADLLAITGDLTLGGASILDLPGSNTYDPGTTYDLITFTGGLSGVFFDVQGLPATHTLEYLGNSVSLVPVPEPSSILLGGIGMAGLGLLGMRKRK